MKLNETILIFAISILGLCIICGIIKLLTKSNETGERYNNACYILFLVSAVLIGVSQLMSGLNSRETMTVGEKVDTPLDRCSKNSSCLNGGVSVEKWPIDLTTGYIPTLENGGCACNCNGGFSGDTCMTHPLDATTGPYTDINGSYPGLSTTVCDTSTTASNSCWKCKNGYAKPRFYDHTYCCGDYSNNCSGSPHKCVWGEIGTNNFCTSNQDCGYYMEGMYNNAEVSCDRMVPPTANTIYPGSLCDRRPGHKNSCCKCEYGVVSGDLNDYCCKRDLTNSSKLQDGCKYQRWTDSSGDNHPGNWDEPLPPQTLCNSTPNNIFTFTIPELTQIPLPTVAGSTVTYTSGDDTGEGTIISYTPNKDLSYLVVEKSSGTFPELAGTSTLTMNNTAITPHTMTPTAIDQNFMGVDTACHRCEYGHYWGGLNDFCCDNILPDPKLAGQICDTRKGYKNQCATCPYGKTRHGLNDWCCREEEKCPPYCATMEKPIGRVNTCLSQKFI